MIEKGNDAAKRRASEFEQLKTLLESLNCHKTSLQLPSSADDAAPNSTWSPITNGADITNGGADTNAGGMDLYLQLDPLVGPSAPDYGQMQELAELMEMDSLDSSHIFQL